MGELGYTIGSDGGNQDIPEVNPGSIEDSSGGGSVESSLEHAEDEPSYKEGQKVNILGGFFEIKRKRKLYDLVHYAGDGRKVEVHLTGRVIKILEHASDVPLEIKPGTMAMYRGRKGDSDADREYEKEKALVGVTEGNIYHVLGVMDGGKIAMYDANYMITAVDRSEINLLIDSAGNPIDVVDLDTGPVHFGLDAEMAGENVRDRRILAEKRKPNPEGSLS